MTWLLLLTSLWASPQAVLTVPDGRLPIVIATQSKNVIGTQFVNEVREELRRSAGYRPVDEPADAKLAIVVTAIDGGCDGAGNGAVVSATIAVPDPGQLPRYLDTAVAVMSASQTHQAAVAFVRSLDQVVANTKKFWP